MDIPGNRRTLIESKRKIAFIMALRRSETQEKTEIGVFVDNLLRQTSSICILWHRHRWKTPIYIRSVSTIKINNRQKFHWTRFHMHVQSGTWRRIRFRLTQRAWFVRCLLISSSKLIAFWLNRSYSCFDVFQKDIWIVSTLLQGNLQINYISLRPSGNCYIDDRKYWARWSSV